MGHSARDRWFLRPGMGEQNTTLLNGLLQYWTMDEASGNRSSSVPVGAVNAVPANNPVGVVGYVNNCAQLQTATPAKYFTVAYDLDSSQSFTFAMLLNWDNFSTQPGIAKSGNGTDWYCLLIGSTQKVRFRLQATALASKDSTALGSTGTWYAVRFGYDASLSQIFVQIDDNAIQTGAVTGTPITTSTSFFLGHYSFAHDGKMDEVGLWQRVLTDDEWAELRGHWGAGRSYPFSGNATILLEVDSPVVYQIFQRSGATGDINITGRTRTLDDVEARFNGGAWATIVNNANGEFSGTLSGQAEGYGTLEVRLVSDISTSVSIENIGIGDIFVIAGQSNADGRANNYQEWSGSPIAIMFKDYGWAELVEPIGGQGGTYGCIWPLIATPFLADQGVPIAFIPCAVGGTSITDWAQSADETTNYGAMAHKINLIGGAKAVLWWQGETDAIDGMSEATYNTNLDNLANAINSDFGCKIMPCKLQSCTGIVDANEAEINTAIATAWGDNANVAQGPDLTGLTSDDPYHLMTDVNLASAAALWWAALQAEFYP